MELTSNINQVFTGIAQQLSEISNPDILLRTIAATLQPVIRDRIHTEGKASDGNNIGTYSDEYISVRSGVYKTNEKYSKGKNKGETKKTGVFTRGEKQGEPRPQYNRGSDKKVILSLTRQMESDFSVQPTEKGYGLGYNNTFNFDKAQWAEITYKKKIFDLTDQERELVVDIANDYIDKALNG